MSGSGTNGNNRRLRRLFLPFLPRPVPRAGRDSQHQQPHPAVRPIPGKFWRSNDLRTSSRLARGRRLRVRQRSAGHLHGCNSHAGIHVGLWGEHQLTLLAIELKAQRTGLLKSYDDILTRKVMGECRLVLRFVARSATGKRTIIRSWMPGIRHSNEFLRVYRATIPWIRPERGGLGPSGESRPGSAPPSA